LYFLAAGFARYRGGTMMNRSRHLPSAIACILTALLVTGAAGGGVGAIACICPDGQVKVEAADCACCDPVSSDDHAVDAASASEQPSCSDCVDVPLHTHPIKTTPFQLDDATVPTPGHAPPAASTVGGERSRPAPPGLGHRLSLELLSSVVIRT
jgi:hypothetical protein